MASDEGAQGPSDGQQPAPLDASDHAAVEAVTTDGVADVMPGLAGLPDATQDIAEIARIQERAITKTQLAQSMSANTHMVVDPAEVDALAAFFEDEAQALEERALDLRELSAVPAPGTDPVSTRAAPIHGQVAVGDDRAYYGNYMKLAQVFRDTGASLRSSAKQTRTDDETAADSFRQGGNLG